MGQKVRDSNIELLRILTICGVVMLHYNAYEAFPRVEQGSVNFFILYALEALFICSVNLFVLISGYFSCLSGKRKVIKPLELLVQVMAFGLLKYLVPCVLGMRAWSFSSLVAFLIPNNYFVFLYLTLYLLSPYINKATGNLSKKQFGFLVGMCLALFSVWPTFLDVVYQITGKSFPGMYTTNTGGSQNGYSLINFALMYLIGAYLRRFDIGKKVKMRYLFLAFLGCIGVIFGWQMVLERSATSYANPVVILSGVFIFLLFRRISIQSKIINSLAKATFTCFLFHDWLLSHLGIEQIVSMNPIVLCGHILVVIPAIFAVSWVVWKVYDFISAPIFRWLGSKLSRLDGWISISE